MEFDGNEARLNITDDLIEFHYNGQICDESINLRQPYTICAVFCIALHDYCFVARATMWCQPSDDVASNAGTQSQMCCYVVSTRLSHAGMS